MSFLTQPTDPRRYQLVVLGTLLTYGIVALDFGVAAVNVATIFATALLTQAVASRLVGLPRVDLHSPLITAFSLTLLLRTDTWMLAAIAALIAIGSKFLIRVDGKHVFNPANFALVLLVVLSDQAWLSAGQWGSATLAAFAFACLGTLVLSHARRAETTLAFLSAFAALVYGRALWLGDPLSIPTHAMQSGALLLFAFFMISDPKTTPDSSVGRLLFGVAVAVLAFVIQFGWYTANGAVYALILLSPTVPLIDRCLPAERYRWRSRQPARPAQNSLPGAQS